MSILIIAEIGINWNGKMDLLRELVFRAKDCGCDIVKTQLYDPIKLFPSREIWAQGKNWFPEVEKTKMSKEQLFQFMDWCKEKEIEGMASAFDLERLSWLEEAGVKRHKVGSGVNKDKELIDAMIATGKEVLVSCQRRTDTHTPPMSLRKNIKYLYCVPRYPTKLPEFKFKEINFPNEFQGFSSHYPGIEPAIIAISRGAQIIEVHFCLRRNVVYNPDITSSIIPAELKQLVSFARKVEEVL